MILNVEKTMSAGKDDMESINAESIGPIQSGIPLPPKPGPRSSVFRVAMEELEVGESRVFSGVASRKLGQTAATIKKVLGYSYAVRRVGDVVRVWRVE